MNKKIYSFIISGLISLSPLCAKNIESVSFDNKLNISANYDVQQELNKIPNGVRKLLTDNKTHIHIEENLRNKFEEGVTTYGVYFWEDNIILLDNNVGSIRYATLHECGHALDDILSLSYNEDIQYSYIKEELKYDNEHFNESIEEYIAQSILEYYNNTLDTDTMIYNALNSELSNI